LLRIGLIKRPYKICIFDDSRDVVLIAAYYLFGKIHNLNNKELAAVESLLVDQKQWVECYTNFGLGYFLEGNIISFAMTLSRYAHHILDVENGRFGFKIPQKGSFLVIENFAIPASSTKVIWAQQFINFMISSQYCTEHFKLYGGNPVNHESYQALKKSCSDDLQYFPCDDLFKKLLLMHNEIPVAKTEDIWLRVKTA
jgi:spermidine/putrescine-binding protein